MIDISKVYDEVIISESKPQHLFNDGKITFAKIRDTFNDVFKLGGVMLSKKVPSMNILVTFKDGDFCVSSDLNELAKPKSFNKVTERWCSAGKNARAAFMKSLKAIIDALREVDPILLNKYFANGQNYMDCCLVFPPEEMSTDYDNRCFVTLNSLKRYDPNFKRSEDDAELAKELFDGLRAKENLAHEISTIGAEKVKELKSCIAANKVLQNITDRLSKFIDGVGWNCTLDSYIQDKYSRFIINKGLEYGLDISRNSAFANELVSRLSGTASKLRPSKTDLMTFAKREGINCHSDQYKNFLADIEQNAEKTSAEIIAPIEDMIYYGVTAALKNILSYMSLDPNTKTQKFLGGVDRGICCMNETDEQPRFKKDKIESLRKHIAKIGQFACTLPKGGVIFVHNGTPLKIISRIGNLEKLCDIIG